MQLTGGGSHAPDDQVALSRLWLDFPEHVALDYTGELFLSTFRLKPAALRRAPDGSIGPAWLPASQPACFLHTNGVYTRFGAPLNRIPAREK